MTKEIYYYCLYVQHVRTYVDVDISSGQKGGHVLGNLPINAIERARVWHMEDVIDIAVCCLCLPMHTYEV